MLPRRHYLQAIQNPKVEQHHRHGTNDSVNKQNIEMNKDDEEKQDPMEEKSTVTVSRNGETHDDHDRDSKR